MILYVKIDAPTKNLYLSMKCKIIAYKKCDFVAWATTENIGRFLLIIFLKNSKAW